MNLRRAALTALLLASVPSFAAQTASAAAPPAQPMFKVLAPHGWIHNPGKHYPVALTTWNGSISYSGHTYNFTMVGTNPATSNSTTTVTTYLVPVRMNYTRAVYGTNHKIFDPLVDTQNGVSIVQNILNSPLFNNVDWNWGGTDVGTEAYNDAAQRAAFWQNVTTNSSYHVVVSPSVLAELKISPSKTQGGAVVSNPFGGSGKIGEMNINSFDAALQGYMRKYATTITPDTLVLFVTDNIYLTSGGCCIGGYHSANGNGQTYGTATYAYSPGAFVFSNDISAFSHEIGEWYEDPLINSNSPCGLLENGDPLEGLANYGDFSITFNGVTWHPQALTTMEYFGDPANFSVNNWLDNQHLLSSVCQHGG